jgi:hypothetical protein
MLAEELLLSVLLVLVFWLARRLMFSWALSVTFSPSTLEPWMVMSVSLAVILALPSARTLPPWAMVVGPVVSLTDFVVPKLTFME